MNLTLPPVRIQTRPIFKTLYDAILERTQNPLLSRIFASRLPENAVVEPLIDPKLSHLSNPSSLKDIEKAASRVVQAIENKEVIALETDHDCDGQTSHAVLYSALIEHFKHPEDKVLSFIGHRLDEGYGLSEILANRILSHDPRPTLVITADNGSSDEPRIQKLKNVGIDVIVTDHHEIPIQGIPDSAFAVINPSRLDCGFPDKAIAGCMVAWLLMTVVRKQLIAKKILPEGAPSLADLLDFVSVGTVADCVSLADSANNRAVVRHGMRRIQQFKRPCWRAVRPYLSSPMSAEDLGFMIGPLLNSDGRLSDALSSVSFLLAKTDEEANTWVKHLLSQNEQRKLIQRRLTQDAMVQASMWVAKGYHSICVFLEEGHPGVQGISASRIKDAFGRPTALFAPKKHHPELITGSLRTIDGFHIRQALEWVASRMTGIVGFGGHKGAAGITLERDALDTFRELFEQVAAQDLHQETLGPVVWTDGFLPPENHTLSEIESLHAGLEPFGRAFEPPTFEMEGIVDTIQPVGDGTHIKLKITGPSSHTLELIWFQARPHPEAVLPVTPGDRVRVAYRVKIKSFRGTIKLEYQTIGCLLQ